MKCGWRMHESLSKRVCVCALHNKCMCGRTATHLRRSNAIDCSTPIFGRFDRFVLNVLFLFRSLLYDSFHVGILKFCFRSELAIFAFHGLAFLLLLHTSNFSLKIFVRLNALYIRLHLECQWFLVIVADNCAVRIRLFAFVMQLSALHVCTSTPLHSCCIETYLCHYVYVEIQLGTHSI